MLTFVYSDHTGSRWLHINNAKLLTRKRAKCVVCQEFVRYLLADWSNPILHIHDDYRWSEVLVCHFVMFAVGVRCVLPNFLLDEKRILPLKKKMASTFGEEQSVNTHFFRWSVLISLHSTSPSQVIFQPCALAALGLHLVLNFRTTVWF